MRQIGIVLKKEFKDFLSRRSRVLRFAVLLLFNILVIMVPSVMSVYLGPTISSNRSMVALYFMLFTTFAILGFLSVDVIGLEKSKKTFETLLSTPIKVMNLFLGKCLFMTFFGVCVLAFTALMDSLLLMAYGTSFMELGYNIVEIFNIFAIAILCIFLFIIISTVLSMVSNNSRVNRYILLALTILMLIGLYAVLSRNSGNLLFIILGILIIVIVFFLIIIVNKLSKKSLMKFFR